MRHKSAAATMDQVCQPLAQEWARPDALYRGLCLVAIDGCNFELP
jgi:hypothetical protein